MGMDYELEEMWKETVFFLIYSTLHYGHLPEEIEK
jgi:hypothetical protein